jgi:shikimate kinase/3-dehydroquinate synthase
MKAKSSLRRLPVEHPQGQYDVIVGSDLLSKLSALAPLGRSIAVVTDTHVGPLYAGQISDVAGVVTVPAGEATKTLATVNGIYEQLLAAGLDRRSTVVALGGGVVGDMAGFVAATYMRGVDFVQCPTSLLAMVDASVGGKTGVDLPQGKNLVGAFKQPTAVVADVTTLKTLPPEEFAAGMAEVIKHGLINDPDLFIKIETGDWRLERVMQSPLSTLQSLIVQAIQVKRDVVQEDPFEQGRRAVLNLGHTFGHAIEQVSHYAVRHGEGVAMGLVAAAHLSAKIGACTPQLQTRIEQVLVNANLPTRIPPDLPLSSIYEAMWHDKKKAANQLRYVLIREVGDVFTSVDVPETAVLETLAAVKG